MDSRRARQDIRAGLPGPAGSLRGALRCEALRLSPGPPLKAPITARRRGEPLLP